MRGSIVELEALAEFPRFLRSEGFVKRSFIMCIEIVHDDDDFLSIRKKPSQILKTLGEID